MEFGGDLNLNGTISPNYKYSSQGQERQSETGWSSYRWRNYDAAMGRFFNLDPLAETYHTWSPFVFSGNRVVDARELEGLEPKKVNEVSLPSDPIEFAEFIGGGINSIRAAFSNSVVRTANVVANDRFTNKFQVESDGSMTLMTGVPKESFKEKVVNGAMDLATLGLAAFGGVEGALTAQGGKAPAIKAIEEVKAAVKAVNGNSKLSTKPQHLYDIFKKTSSDVVKTGISGGKISKAEKSYRATKQVNKMNKEAGADIYDSRVVKKFPGGAGSRQKALDAEVENANKHRETLDPDKHKRP
ncbi:hypothetical protein CEQ15_14145 [Chryseobacterium indologenes]|uniref:RHS repeat-associated core domain-containing protein n=1 Tax=Chryseobacterium indologenes TaxID=253 RepID=UPI000B517E9D|nr:RHS repeat-associated core domain-containing protein [Chryseobacterium indologenes]ASE62554.1 hypothetical protein CEQ15_14145 [Chryseobacterium indologenes]